jgi:1-acyl-sn-glycerol-3-phosphate acyltransferase
LNVHTAPKRRHYGPPGGWPDRPGRVPGPWRRSCGAVRGLVKFILVFSWLGVWFSIVAFSVPLLGLPRPGRRLLRFFRRTIPGQLLRIVGVRLRTVGRPPAPPCLVVSNHLGWIDALAYGTLAGPVFVAVARRVPMVSFLMRAFGTVIVGRDDITVLERANRALAAANRAGERTMVFPEGNSYWGHEVMPFKAPLFQSAIDARVPVYAAAIRFDTPLPWPPASMVAAWGDYTPIIVHILHALQLPRIDVTVTWSDRPLAAATRKRLAALARDEVLRLFVPTP